MTKFPLTLLELTKMRKDNDKWSIGLAYSCMGCIALLIIALTIYYLTGENTAKIISILTVPLSAIFLLILYIHRPNFLYHRSERIKTIYNSIVDRINIERATPAFQNGSLEYILSTYFSDIDKPTISICIEMLRDQREIEINVFGKYVFYHGKIPERKNFNPFGE